MAIPVARHGIKGPNASAFYAKKEKPTTACAVVGLYKGGTKEVLVLFPQSKLPTNFAVPPNCQDRLGH